MFRSGNPGIEIMVLLAALHRESQVRFSYRAAALELVEIPCPA